MPSTNQHISDETILALLKERPAGGAEKGMRLLMDKYQERLFWVVFKLTNSREDAADVLQNTFVKAFRAIGRFEKKSQLYTWLYRIATNESFTFLKKRKRNQTVGFDNEESGIVNQLTAPTFHESEKIEALLAAAIETLPEKQQMVFMMRYYDEMPYEKISEALGTSQGALKASYHHAAKKIESYLKTSDFY